MDTLTTPTAGLEAIADRIAAIAGTPERFALNVLTQVWMTTTANDGPKPRPISTAWARWTDAHPVPR